MGFVSLGWGRQDLADKACPAPRPILNYSNNGAADDPGHRTVSPERPDDRCP
jgi:hypothetical protein